MSIEYFDANTQTLVFDQASYQSLSYTIPNGQDGLYAIIISNNAVVSQKGVTVTINGVTAMSARADILYNSNEIIVRLKAGATIEKASSASVSTSLVARLLIYKLS